MSEFEEKRKKMREQHKKDTDKMDEEFKEEKEKFKEKKEKFIKTLEPFDDSSKKNSINFIKDFIIMFIIFIIFSVIGLITIWAVGVVLALILTFFDKRVTGIKDTIENAGLSWIYVLMFIIRKIKTAIIN